MRLYKPLQWLPTRALAAVVLLGLAAPGRADGPDGGPPTPPPPPPVPTECQKLDSRIAKRRDFLAIRAQEKILHPTNPTFSPFCENHPADEDCQLPGLGQDQQDLSRDVSEYDPDSNGETTVNDPILIPLQRRKRELHCPAGAHAPPR